MVENDSVQVTTVLAVEPDHAFEIFTEETDLWWGKGPRFRPLSHPQGRMIFEKRAGGRLLECVGENATPDFVLGHIQVWDPPARLVFSMGGRDFGSEDWPVVEILFDPVPEGTRVTLEHRGFAALVASHPVRRGLDGRMVEPSSTSWVCSGPTCWRWRKDTPSPRGARRLRRNQAETPSPLVPSAALSISIRLTLRAFSQSLLRFRSKYGGRSASTSVANHNRFKWRTNPASRSSS